MQRCFNSCGQHHVADIGFLGVSRMIGSRRVPHFQLVVGGQWSENGRAFGLAIGAIPSKRAPEAALRLSSRYVAERLDGETFRAWVERIGKKTIRAAIEDLTQVPPYEVDPSYYSDWGDTRVPSYTDRRVRWRGRGRRADGLAASEREVFEAQLLLDQGEPRAAALRAYSAMLVAARALTREKNANLGEDPGEIVSEFRTALVDTKLFHDPFAGAKFAHYLFSPFRHQRVPREEAPLTTQPSWMPLTSATLTRCGGAVVTAHSAQVYAEAAPDTSSRAWCRSRAYSRAKRRGLIDVADYRTSQGPGIVRWATARLRAELGEAAGAGAPASASSDPLERLSDTFRRAFAACRLLEADAAPACASAATARIALLDRRNAERRRCFRCIAPLVERALDAVHGGQPSDRPRG
jgi:hypothetical protein